MSDSIADYVINRKPNATKDAVHFPNHPYADDVSDYNLVPLDRDPFAATKSGEPHPPVPAASAETQQMGGEIAQGAGSLLESAADPAIRLGKVVTGTSQDIWGDLAQTELGLAGPELKGATLAAKPLLSIFAGIGAKTADREALNLAQKMVERGFPREQIWDATGWFQGADQKWRFEIPDQESFEAAGRTPVGSRVHHPSLLEAYPDLGAVPVKDNPSLLGAAYYDTPESIEMGKNEPHLSMLHELQHAIQKREGFARGGNTDTTRRVALEVLKDHPPPEHWDAVDRLKFVNKLADEAYARLAGEVESRNVEFRARFTPQERKTKYPWSTEDRPRDKQTVIGTRQK
jgi:hypothetical protein